MEVIALSKVYSATVENWSSVPSKNQKQKSSLESTNLPLLNVIFTNADQLTSSKMSEIKKHIENEKPMIVAVCEMKPKNARDGCLPDYNITNFSKHPVNLDTNIDRGMVVYTNTIDKSVIQITPELDFEEVCLLEIKLRGGDLLLFGCFYRSPTPSNRSQANNENLDQLLQRISNKSYSHKCFVGDFDLKDINWVSWTTFHNTE